MTLATIIAVFVWRVGWTVVAGFVLAVIGYGIGQGQASANDGFLFGAVAAGLLLAGWLPFWGGLND